MNQGTKISKFNGSAYHFSVEIGFVDKLKRRKGIKENTKKHKHIN